MATEEQIVPFSVQRTKVVWLDVNTQVGLNGKPELLPDVHAIQNALRNLFRCPIGARGRIFRPDYGNHFWRLLQEPKDEITAAKVRASLIQTIQRWEPRILLNQRQTQVIPSTQLNGFIVRVVYIYLLTNDARVATFLVTP